MGLLLTLGGVCVSSPSSFAPGPAQARVQRTAQAARGGQGEASPKTWQQGLDTALLDVDATVEQRLSGLQAFISSPFEVVEALSTAAASVAEKGIGKGHPEALDAIFPKGTLARSDLDGLAALARQAPDLLESLKGSVPDILSRSATDSRGPVNVSNAADAAEDAAARIARLLSPEMREEAVQQLGNIFRRTPKGLEEPAYERILGGEGFELRLYKNFTVARRKMAAEAGQDFSSQDGFSSLAAYLFGDNQEKRAMKMTMPVEIAYDGAKPGQRAMSFMLPSEESQASQAPQPRDPSIELIDVAESLVAVREFPAIATAKEVERQLSLLLEALEADGSYMPLDAARYSVLQYNPPYTLPWRRRNEIVLAVTQRSQESDSRFGTAVADAEVIESVVDPEVVDPEAGNSNGLEAPPSA